MKVNAKLTLALLALVFCLAACTEEESPWPVPEVSHLNVPLEVIRFDEALLALDTADLERGIARLDGNFGEFADLYLTHLVPLRRGDFSPAEQREILKAFLRYPLTREIAGRVEETFPDALLEQQREQIVRALQYFRYYLPDAALPDTLVTYLAQFELAGLLYGDGNLAVGLDLFLGPDFDYGAVDPREPIFSDYLARTYTPAHLTAKMMRLLAEDYLPRPRSGRLIDYIVYEGKILYLLRRVLPETPDSILHEVTAAEMDWLRENEIRIYAHLQKEDQLYATGADVVRKLTQPAPSSPGMPPESPGRSVNYLGRRIVEAYVRTNPRVSMPELLAITDGQRILAGARYKPK